MAGCGAEGVFDGIELGTELFQKCVGWRQFLAGGLSVQDPVESFSQHTIVSGIALRSKRPIDCSQPSTFFNSERSARRARISH